MTDELERAICAGVVSSVAVFGFANDAENQRRWLEIAEKKYGLTVQYYLEKHPERKD